MSTTGRFSDAVFFSLKAQLPNLSDEEVASIAGKVSDVAFDIAFNFGKNIGWENAEDYFTPELERERSTNQRARKVALFAAEWMASDNDDTKYEAFSEALSDWRQNFIDNDDTEVE